MIAIAVAAARRVAARRRAEGADRAPASRAVLADGAIVRDQADGFGFPSGHTTMAFALAAVLHPLLPPRLRWIPWVLAVAGRAWPACTSGVHWPMDVVGGAALGIAIGGAAGAADRRAATVAAEHEPPDVPPDPRHPRDDAATRLVQRRVELALYLAAGVTYVGFGMFHKFLLNWIIGPVWLVAWVWLVPALIEAVRRRAP